jgi:PAS domain-containing protein
VLPAGRRASYCLVRLARGRNRARAEMTAIVRNSTVPVFIRDRRFRYILCNPAFEELYGTDDGGSVGKPADEVLPLALHARARVNDARVFAAETVTDECVVQVREHDALTAMPTATRS